MNRRRRTAFKPGRSPSSPTWISDAFRESHSGTTPRETLIAVAVASDTNFTVATSAPREKVRLRARRLFIAATAAAVATLLVGSAPATLATPPPPATNLLQRRLAATGVTPERMEYQCGSDYVAFIEAGIPAAGGFTGDDEVKTRKQAALLGDRLDNINVKSLDRYTDAAAGTIAHFAISVSDLPAR